MPKPDIHELYKHVGGIDEERFYNVLKQRHKKVEREVPIKVKINENLEISGRKDFVAANLIYEKKSTFSKTATKTLAARQPIEYQLAQLVTYLLLSKMDQGVLAVTSYEFSKDLKSLNVKDEHEYQIKLQSNTILVDGNAYPRTISDLRRYFMLMREAYETGELPPMPRDWNQQFKSPCKYCPIKEVCHLYEQGEVEKEEFLEQAQEQIKTDILTAKTRPVSIPVSKK